MERADNADQVCQQFAAHGGNSRERGGGSRTGYGDRGESSAGWWHLGALTFSVPCVIASPAPAASQTRARLGAYYFDGWSGPLTNFHFQGLPLGPYQDRQPVSGWQDNTDCAMEQQLAWAHNFGIDFFVFDWYFNPAVTASGENLDSASRSPTPWQIATACSTRSCT